MTVVPEPVWQVGSSLGEGPAWIVAEQALRFVDIKQGLVHRFDPATGDRDTIATGGNPSFVVPVEGGGLLAGSRNQVLEITPSGFGRVLAAIDQPDHNRTNDATVDSLGRLWITTMDDDEMRPTGSLWCLDRGTLRCAGTNAVVANGPAVTRDCRHLYLVDSGARTISRFEIDDDGRLGRRTPFLTLGEEDGHPDGIVLDCEDCLWVALWDRWGVRRYAPDGALLLHVEFPCARITKVAFGGADLDMVYVTSARTGLDADALEKQPLAGSLFAFKAPCRGRPLPSVRLR